MLPHCNIEIEIVRSGAAREASDEIDLAQPFHQVIVRGDRRLGRLGAPLGDALREHVDPRLGRLTFGAVVASLNAHIDDMLEQPILIGHSVGGLAVQKLVNDGYGRAGVAISPAPPLGVLSAAPDFVKANWPHLDPFAGDRPIVMTKERFHYTFCNTMTRDESDAAYDLYVVPESRNVPRTTLTRQALVDFSRDHVPLLLMAGDSDHLTPAAMIRRNARRYELMVEVREFADRSHFLCNQDGWEEVADAAFDFASAI